MQLTLDDTHDVTNSVVGNAVTFVVWLPNNTAPIGPMASLSVVAPAVHAIARYTTPVIMIARNVPCGIAFCGSCEKDNYSAMKKKKGKRKVQGLPQLQKKVREKSRECHNHKPQPFPDPKRKRKPTNLNKHKPNKRTKSTKISSLFPKRGNRNTKRTEKHKNKITHGKTYNKSPRKINHKATKE